MEMKLIIIALIITVLVLFGAVISLRIILNNTSVDLSSIKKNVENETKRIEFAINNPRKYNKGDTIPNTNLIVTGYQVEISGISYYWSYFVTNIKTGETTSITG